MTVRTWETPESRNRHAADDLSNTGTLQYMCTGTTDDQAAGDAILAQVATDWPSGFRGMSQKTLDLKPLGGDMWLGDVQYVNAFSSAQRDPPDTGEFRVTCAPGNASQRIRFAKAGRTTPYTSGGTAPDYKGAIGVDNSDGKITVEGAEIPVAGGTQLNLHYRVPKANITPAYVDTLDSLRGRRNAGTFYGYTAKRLLFLGADLTDSMRGDDEGVFHFLIDRQVTLDIGDITGIIKPPHDYLDVVWEYEKDPVTHVLIPKPKAVYVHDLIDTADFADLGIGTGP